MRAILTLVTVALTALVAFPAGSAEHCSDFSSADPEVDTTSLGSTYYVDADVDRPGSIWVYEETNGIVGLQRGDEVRDNTCHGLIESDTIIF